MNRLRIMFIFCINSIFAMNQENPLSHKADSPPHMRRSLSDSSFLPSSYQFPRSLNISASSSESYEFSDTDYENTQNIDLDEQDDELAQLARLTSNPSADPLATLRGIHRRTTMPNRPRTHEATYDDIARLIQFNSRAALSEARTLNKAYLEAILAQLQQEASTMRTEVGDGVSRVSISLANLDERLQGAEKLLTRVKKLLDQEKTLADTYEGTCTRLSTAFQAYKQAVEEKEISAIELLQTLARNQQELKEKMNALDRRTIAINYTGEEVRNTMHLQRWKDNFMSACALVTSMGILTFIISYCIGGNHETGTIETNASLHPTV